MRYTMRLLHVLGLTLFLGSILTYAIASGLAASAVGDVAFTRRLVEAGVRYLTLPGLGVIIVSGAGLAAGRFRPRENRWLGIKLVVTGAIVANAVLFILPAARQASGLAAASVAAGGQLLAGYAEAYAIETVAGAVNIGLALLAAVFGIVRPSLRRSGP